METRKEILKTKSTMYEVLNHVIKFYTQMDQNSYSVGRIKPNAICYTIDEKLHSHILLNGKDEEIPSVMEGIHTYLSDLTQSLTESVDPEPFSDFLFSVFSSNFKEVKPGEYAFIPNREGELEFFRKLALGQEEIEENIVLIESQEAKTKKKQ